MAGTPPNSYTIAIPDCWPRCMPRTGDIGALLEQTGATVDPVRRAALLAQIGAATIDAWEPDLLAIMTPVGRPIVPVGFLVVGLSARAGEILGSLLGITTADLADLGVADAGRLVDTKVETITLDGPGVATRVSATRRGGGVRTNVPGLQHEVYLVPEPHTGRAAVLMFTTIADDQVIGPFGELCDLVVTTFDWVW
jgi:hypothetical protein